MGILPKLRGQTLYTLMKIVCGTSFIMYGVSNKARRFRCAGINPRQYDTGVLGGVLLHPPFLDAIAPPRDVWTIPMITALYDLAACVTALAILPLTFRIGRRGTILLGNLAAVFGAVI